MPDVWAKWYHGIIFKIEIEKVKTLNKIDDDKMEIPNIFFKQSIEHISIKAIGS